MQKQRRWTVPFLDLSNVLFFFFVALFTVALLVIGDSETKAKIDTTARYVIHLTWRDDSANDVDLWLKLPNAETVGFRHRQAGFASLDRDDLGIGSSTAVDADGNVITSTTRDEVIFLRGTMVGTYVAAVHLYHQSDASPEPLTVSLVSVDPSYHVVLERKLVLTDNHEEITAFRFTVDAAGDITSTDLIEEPFVNETLGAS